MVLAEATAWWVSGGVEELGAAETSGVGGRGGLGRAEEGWWSLWRGSWWGISAGRLMERVGWRCGGRSPGGGMTSGQRA